MRWVTSDLTTLCAAGMFIGILMPSDSRHTESRAPLPAIASARRWTLVESTSVGGRFLQSLQSPPAATSTDQFGQAYAQYAPFDDTPLAPEDAEQVLIGRLVDLALG